MKRRKLLSLLVAAAMVLSLLPMSALAAETEAASIDDQITNAKSGDTITLDGDASFSSFNLTEGKEIAIELNGHTLTLSKISP